MLHSAIAKDECVYALGGLFPCISMFLTNLYREYPQVCHSRLTMKKKGGYKKKKDEKINKKKGGSLTNLFPQVCHLHLTLAEGLL